MHDSKGSSGAAKRALARRNQMLPLAWHNLSDIDVDEIYSAIDNMLDGSLFTRISINRLRAALAIEAILSTGRSLTTLLKTEFVTGVPEPDAMGEHPRLHVNERPCWLFPSASPSDNPDRARINKEQAYVRSDVVRLDVSDRTLRLAIALRERVAAGRRLLPASGAKLSIHIKHILKHRQCSERVMWLETVSRRVARGCRSHPPQAKSTVEAVERRAIHAIVGAAGGSIGLAAAITGADSVAGKAQSYYSNITGHKAREVLRAINGTALQLSTARARYADNDNEDERTGGTFLPKDLHVQRLIAAIRAEYTKSESDPVARHRSLTEHTVVLVTFALGLRGNSTPLPASLAIQESGFVVVHDKDRENSDKARLSWIAETARAQIERYETHLSQLEAVLPHHAKKEFRDPRGRKAHELMLYDLHHDGAVKRTNPHVVLGGLLRHGWELPKNAGRHWLYCKLQDLCSSEVLSAFFGHWELGCNPWSRSSCLDPLAYREQLAEHVPALLEGIGCEPLGPTEQDVSVSKYQSGGRSERQRRRFFRRSLGQECAVPLSLERVLRTLSPHSNLNPHFRAGQLLCSAIINSAQLSPARWEALLSQHFRPEEHLTRDKQGWEPDPETKKLIRHLRVNPPSRLGPAGHEDEGAQCLKAFFDYPQFRTRPSLALTDLLNWAELRWSLRLPPLLLEFACGRVRSVALKQSDWQRLLGNPQKGIIKTETGPRRRNYFDWLIQNLPAEHRALFGPWEDYRQGRTRLLRAKRQSASALLKLKESIPGECPLRVLQTFGAALLLAKRRRPCRLGYAHHTVRTYVTCLAAELFGGRLRAVGPRITSDEVKARLAVVLPHIANQADRDQLLRAADLLTTYLTAPNAEVKKALKGKSHEAFLNCRTYAPAHEDSDPSGWEDEGENQRVVSANLISSREYQAALQKAAFNADLQLAFVLGFRAGLRLPEILGLRLRDFRSSGSRFELTVRRNERRELKTPSSRRVIPLDVLLTENESSLLMTRFNALGALDFGGLGDPFLLGPPGAKRMLPLREFEEQAGNILKEACGTRGVHFRHLRHSFVSYLIATLLLPKSATAQTVPAHLRPDVSPERKKIVHDRLLNVGRLGQGAIHAVSQLVGHTGVNMTVSTYAHLMDFSLSLYTRRETGALDPELLPNFLRRSELTSLESRDFLANIEGGGPRQPPKSQGEKNIPPRVSGNGAQSLARTPSWRAIYQTIFSRNADRSSVIHGCGIDETEAAAWIRSFEANKRALFGPKPRSQSVTMPQGVDANNLADKMWNFLAEQDSASTDRLVSGYLARFDRKRTIARFSSVREAAEFKSLLVKCGLRPTDAVLVSSREYGSSLVRSGQHNGLLASKWALSECDLDGHEQQLLDAERTGGAISTVLALSVGTKCPYNRENTYRRIKKSQLDRTSVVVAPVRQRNYAVRFTLIIYSLYRSLNISREKLD